MYARWKEPDVPEIFDDATTLNELKAAFALLARAL